MKFNLDTFDEIQRMIDGLKKLNDSPIDLEIAFENINNGFAIL